MYKKKIDYELNLMMIDDLSRGESDPELNMDAFQQMLEDRRKLQNPRNKFSRSVSLKKPRKAIDLSPH